MEAIVFDGGALAREREEKLKQHISANRLRLRMGSVLFHEDPASIKYIDLKKQAAVRVGIEFSVETLSLSEPVELLQHKISSFCTRNDFQGVMIQKPSKLVWQKTHPRADDRMDTWWNKVVAMLDPGKDVDCLTPANLDKIYRGNWRLLPATVKAVLQILHKAYVEYKVFSNQQPGFDLTGVKAVVIGRSDIVGNPLASVLEQYGAQVALFGSDLDPHQLAQADLIVTATGVSHLIKGDQVKQGVVAIDVGSPDAEFEFESVKSKATFITPVPNGVGPVTVISLLENLVEMSVI